MKQLSICCLVLMLHACNSGDKNQESTAISLSNVSNHSSDTINNTTKQSKQLTENDVKKYDGAFFEVKYPATFEAKGETPSNQGDEGKFDAAVFTNDQGTIAFYVFSPRHWYEPKGVLEPLPNEKKVSEEKKGNNEEYDQYITFASKDGSYTRSIHRKFDMKSMRNYVFGIQYTDQATYDAYKTAYQAFKKSLVQYH